MINLHWLASDCSGSGRKLQEQTVFSGPAGVAEQEGYTQFKPLEAEAFEKYNAAGLGDTEGGEPLVIATLFRNLKVAAVESSSIAAVLPAVVSYHHAH
jgi:hypothetical protein